MSIQFEIHNKLHTAIQAALRLHAAEEEVQFDATICIDFSQFESGGHLTGTITLDGGKTIAEVFGHDVLCLSEYSHQLVIANNVAAFEISVDHAEEYCVNTEDALKQAGFEESLADDLSAVACTAIKMLIQHNKRVHVQAVTIDPNGDVFLALTGDEGERLRVVGDLCERFNMTLSRLGALRGLAYGSESRDKGTQYLLTPNK